ncbi:protein transporter tim9 [Collariella sp. IMI 366227]|nr:protein transporter tim9 [Collariella sp. IMI 366227]
MNAGLTPAEERELEARMQRRQVKDFMTVFGGMVDNCFTACVDDFTSKALSGRETGCISRCVTKSMTTQTRLSERFAEMNAGANAEQKR